VLLFIDDERRRMAPFVEELEASRYPVHFEEQADSAWQFFETHKAEIKLVILDIMMAPGGIGDSESPGAGSRTGVLLFERIRSVTPRMLVIIFTNVSDPAVAQRFARENECQFFRKASLLPHELVAEVRAMLDLVR